MIDKHTARTTLGTEATYMSDEQIDSILNMFYSFAEVAYEEYTRKRLANNTIVIYNKNGDC